MDGVRWFLIRANSTLVENRQWQKQTTKHIIFLFSEENPLRFFSDFPPEFSQLRLYADCLLPTFRAKQSKRQNEAFAASKASPKLSRNLLETDSMPKHPYLPIAFFGACKFKILDRQRIKSKKYFLL